MDCDVEISARIIFTYLQGCYRVVHVLKTGEQLWQEIESLLTRLADFRRSPAGNTLPYPSRDAFAEGRKA